MVSFTKTQKSIKLIVHVLILLLLSIEKRTIINIVSQI